MSALEMVYWLKHWWGINRSKIDRSKLNVSTLNWPISKGRISIGRKVKKAIGPGSLGARYRSQTFARLSLQYCGNCTLWKRRLSSFRPIAFFTFWPFFWLIAFQPIAFQPIAFQPIAFFSTLFLTDRLLTLLANFHFHFSTECLNKGKLTYIINMYTNVTIRLFQFS